MVTLVRAVWTEWKWQRSAWECWRGGIYMTREVHKGAVAAGEKQQPTEDIWSHSRNQTTWWDNKRQKENKNINEGWLELKVMSDCNLREIGSMEVSKRSKKVIEIKKDLRARWSGVAQSVIFAWARDWIGAKRGNIPTQ